VLTAKHCFAMDSRLMMAGGIDGTVVWQSGDDDVELIEVLPDATTSPIVGPGSGHDVAGGIAGGVYGRWLPERLTTAGTSPHQASGSSSLAGPGIPAPGDPGGPAHGSDGTVYGAQFGMVYAWASPT
jgi:hypothetical protein